MTTVRLIQGDCLEVMKEMESGSIDAVVTDPPYGIGLRNHGRNGIRKSRGGRIRSDRDWNIANDESPRLAEAVIRWADDNNKPIVTFASPYRPLGGRWRNVLVWDKGPAVGGGGDPKTCWKRTFELIYMNNTGILSGLRDSAVLRFHVSPNFRGDFDHHPAQKPLPMMKYLIQKITNPGDTVFDPFMGSGSTGVACIQTGRNFIGIELDPDHFAVAERRIEAARMPLLDAMS